MAEFAGVLPPQSRLQEYEIERVLGRPGGFGITYLATDTHLAKQVAIKEFLPTEFAVRGPDDSVTVRSEEDSEAFRWGLKSFLNEARVLARFKHPNVVEVHRYFEANNTAYIVMEYVQGETLHEVLKRESTLDEARIRAILMPVADGLQVLHDAGVVHRDIKPDNIIIRPDGVPVLIDFGAARNSLGSRSSMLSVLLTPGYAPIEQYSATGAQGPWSDIYALGAVAYRMIDGQRPCDSVSRIDQDNLIPASRAGAGRYSPSMLAAVDRAMSVHAGGRQQTIAQWRAEMFEGQAGPSRTLRLAPTLGNETTVIAPALPEAMPLPPPRSEALPARPRWPGFALAAALIGSVGLAAEWHGYGPSLLIARLDAPKVTIVPPPPPPPPTVVAAAAWVPASEAEPVPVAEDADEEPAPAPAPAESGASAPPIVEAARNEPRPATKAQAVPATARPAEAAPTAAAAPAPPSPEPAAAPIEVAALSASPSLPDAAGDALVAEIVEPAEFAGMLDAHNQWRARYGVAPLRWSEAGARNAQRWADQLSTEGCELRFDTDPARRTVFRDNLLHVFAANEYEGYRRTPQQVVERWGKAEPLYDVEARRCSSATGGCTQFAKVVDAQARAVGCGRARCEAGEVWVCSYTTSG